MSDSPRIAVWDTYQQQSNPIVIEDSDEQGNGWRDLTVADIVKAVKQELVKDDLR